MTDLIHARNLMYGSMVSMALTLIGLYMAYSELEVLRNVGLIFSIGGLAFITVVVIEYIHQSRKAKKKENKE